MLFEEAKGAEGGAAAGGKADVKAATIVDAGKVDVKADVKADAGNGEVKGYWPADWQQRLAGEDASDLKQIGRYASPEDIWKKARSLEKRMSSGEFKTTLPKDAKPEELQAWRKDNGIPETADKYDLKFDGLVIGKEDKPAIDAFVKKAHEANMTPEQVRATVEYRFQEREKETRERATKDEDQRIKTLDVLNGEWGGGFRRNVNLVNNMLDRFPADVRDALKSARLPDGTAMFNDPNVLRGFVAMALEANPAGVIVPAGGGEPGKAALEEYQDIQKTMKENRGAYDKDGNKQSRMRELINYLSKQGLIDGQGNIKQAA